MRPFVLAVVVFASAARAEELAEVGASAPPFRLPVYNGAAMGFTAAGLDRYVGAQPDEKGTTALLVSFMASFCGPCKKEMPYLEELYERYRSRGLRVLVVSIDSEPEGQKKVEDLIAQHHITFPVLKDRFNLVARRWLGTKSPLPSLFMLRPNGTVASVHRGYSEDGVQLLRREVESAIAASR